MSIEERLLKLEARLQAMEDRMQILQLIAAYGPAADSLDGDALAASWTDDAVYDTDVHRFSGREELRALTDFPQHRQLVEAGAAHTLSLPWISIDGDEAVAVNYSHVHVREGDQHVAVRVSANRWRFIRTADGWRIAMRANRRLGASDAARSLLHVTG